MPIWFDPKFKLQKNNFASFGVLILCLCFHGFNVGFLGSFPMQSKGPNEKVCMSHLFKWRKIRLESEIQWERLIWEKKQLQIIKREKIIVIFTYPLESVRFFHIVIADLFIVGSSWFLDNRFYAHDTSNC